MRRLACVLALAASSVAGAQVKPNATWRTIESQHFRVHFTPELDTLARRAMVYAESAYVKLSAHLRPPRGMIDIVVADNVDYSNGYASVTPTNRIIIYANPPTTESALRFTDDHTLLLVTHELAHIFHLDRVSGVWRIAQWIFGRDPSYFPNSWHPAWFTEGLAVYYESLLTGSGRLEGTDHRMTARTQAAERVFPRIDELSLASARFPYGYSAYAYGSLFVEHLAQTYGDSSISRYVESSSSGLIPVWLGWPARRAFRTSLTSAYTTWADSLRAVPVSREPAIAGWRDVTMHGAYAEVPRWRNDSTILYSGSNGKESYAAFELTLGSSNLSPGSRVSSDRRRLGRRNSRSPTVFLPDSVLLYSQHEFLSPYEFRSDLYIEHGGRVVRVSKGARLSLPAARQDGLIVAMHTVPGGTRLALTRVTGARLSDVTPITEGGLDEHWTEPSWSPDGQHIAAIRWMFGGIAAVVVIDTTGRIEQTIVRERAVSSAPSWSPDGRHVYFSSDRTGIAQLYRAEFRVGDTTAVTLERLSNTESGLFEPQVSPDGRLLAAVTFRADGLHIGVASMDSLKPTLEASRVDSGPGSPVLGLGSSVSKPYSAWGSLRPRYWYPYWEPSLDSNSVRLGAYTEGQDLVGRHYYRALLYVPTDNTGLTGAFSYTNARFGQPLIDVAYSQDKTNRACVTSSVQQGQCIGFLRRRVRDGSVSLTVNRIRSRTASFVNFGAGLEARDYRTEPESLLISVDTVFWRSYYYPRIFLSMGWSNTQRPLLSVSLEDGMSFSTTSRLRWRTSDTVASTLSIVSQASIFRSIPLRGFAHHVVALRGAFGWIDSRGTEYLEAGGVSGGTIEIFPGYSLGEGRRTFGVRGFPAASMRGMRAYAATAEYRVPLAILARGLGTLPFFLDRSSLSLFGDVGSAWCPGVYPTRPTPALSLCTQGDHDIGRTVSLGSFPIVYSEAYTLGSVGGELSFTAAGWSWDNPFRYRFGMARPVIGQNLTAGVSATSLYFAVGAYF